MVDESKKILSTAEVIELGIREFDQKNIELKAKSKKPEDLVKLVEGNVVEIEGILGLDFDREIHPLRERIIELCNREGIQVPETIKGLSGKISEGEYRRIQSEYEAIYQKHLFNDRFFAYMQIKRSDDEKGENYVTLLVGTDPDKKPVITKAIQDARKIGAYLFLGEQESLVGYLDAIAQGHKADERAEKVYLPREMKTIKHLSEKNWLQDETPLMLCLGDNMLYTNTLSDWQVEEAGFSQGLIRHILKLEQEANKGQGLKFLF